MSFARFEPRLERRDTADAAGDRRVARVLAAVEAMAQAGRPESFGEQRWFMMLKDIRGFAESWLEVALGHGWSLAELFGWPPRIEHRRLDLTGAVLVLGGRPVTSVDPARITIANRLGPDNIFHRRPRSGARLIWTVVMEERLGC